MCSDKVNLSSLCRALLGQSRQSRPSKSANQKHFLYIWNKKTQEVSCNKLAGIKPILVYQNMSLGSRLEKKILIRLLLYEAV
jgi:hypothetical protein